MIIQGTATNELVPHYKNIFDILEINPITKLLSWTNATIAGGFATALFAAPRLGHPPGLISRQYYKDIDIYPHDADDRAAIIDILETAFANSIVRTHNTDRARTYTIKLTNKKNKTKVTWYTAQVMMIPEREGPVKNIFDTYDFVTSVVAITLKNKEIFFHEDFTKHHVAKELVFYKPHYFNVDSAPEDIIIQLLRIHKYCIRWDYKLATDTLSRLLQVYHAQPGICLDPTKTYSMNSGDTGKLITTSDANIWKLMSRIIKEAPSWADTLDEHGLITDIQPKEELIDINSLFSTMNTTKHTKK